MAKPLFEDNVSKNIANMLKNQPDEEWGKKASRQLLTLSRREVPFDQSDLSKSGQADKDNVGYYTAYTKEYSAYQHEGMRADGSRIIRKYQNGRKSKYLEDPLKQNLTEWGKIGKDAYTETIKKAT